MRTAAVLAGPAALALLAGAAASAEITYPVLVPLTGFLALEGTSQRNGALLAIQDAPPGITVKAPVADVGTAPELVVNAFEKVAGDRGVVAVGASMLGPQLLALLPLAREAKLP